MLLNFDRMNKLSIMKKRRFSWFGLFIILAFMLLTVYIAKFYQPTIHLNHYVIATYADDGSVDLSVDWDTIKKIYGNKITYTTQAKSDLSGIVDSYAPIDFLSDDVSVMTDSVFSLSDDDSLPYYWIVYPEEIEMYLNCNLEYSDTSAIISHLTENITLNPFDRISIILWNLSTIIIVVFFIFLLLFYYLVFM